MKGSFSQDERATGRRPRHTPEPNRPVNSSRAMAAPPSAPAAATALAPSPPKNASMTGRPKGRK
jgi:hypothetical protein